MNEIDLAYAAGIIDGEGYIGIIQLNRNKFNEMPRYQMRLTVSMATLAVPAWLHNTFGGSFYIFNSPCRKKPLQAWRVDSDKALAVLEIIYPYLKEKQQEAQIAIEFQKMRTVKRCNGNPKPLWETQIETILAEQLADIHVRSAQYKGAKAD